jgi:hypothetical protein
VLQLLPCRVGQEPGTVVRHAVDGLQQVRRQGDVHPHRRRPHRDIDKHRNRIGVVRVGSGKPTL